MTLDVIFTAYKSAENNKSFYFYLTISVCLVKRLHIGSSVVYYWLITFQEIIKKDEYQPKMLLKILIVLLPTDCRSWFWFVIPHLWHSLWHSGNGLCLRRHLSYWSFLSMCLGLHTFITHKLNQLNRLSNVNRSLPNEPLVNFQMQKCFVLEREW